jgi:hypothetical protein
MFRAISAREIFFDRSMRTLLQRCNDMTQSRRSNRNAVQRLPISRRLIESASRSS